MVLNCKMETNIFVSTILVLGVLMTNAFFCYDVNFDNLDTALNRALLVFISFWNLTPN